MKQPELESILRKARLPEISDESLEMFPRRVVARLNRDDLPIRTAKHFFPRLAWAFGLAVCVVMAVAISHWVRRDKNGNPFKSRFFGKCKTHPRNAGNVSEPRPCHRAGRTRFEFDFVRIKKTYQFQQPFTFTFATANGVHHL